MITIIITIITIIITIMITIMIITIIIIIDTIIISIIIIQGAGQGPLHGLRCGAPAVFRRAVHIHICVYMYISYTNYINYN